MLMALGQRARFWVSGVAPWTNVYGLARTVLALGTAGTLMFSHSSSLFRPGARIPDVPQCESLRQASLFCLVPSNALEVARWLAVAILLVVASGWRPRLTGLLHWWVTASLSVSALVLDGGDHVAAVLSFLLVPLALTDPRRWHWSAPPPPQAEPRDEAQRLVAHSAHLATRLQMAGIYLHAAVGKLKVEEWVDGTALYYWMTNNFLGVPSWLQQLMMPLLSRPVVALLTWGVLVFEFLLFMALTFGRPARRMMLPLGIAFHMSIMFAYGLTSFFASMSAGLLLLLRPLDEPFNFGLMWSRLIGLLPLRTKRSSASVEGA